MRGLGVQDIPKAHSTLDHLYLHLKMIEMETNSLEEKIDIDLAIENLVDRDIRNRDQMDIHGPHREELLSRYHSIKSLNIRFRKQYNEMKSLLFKHAGKELDFLKEPPEALGIKAIMDSMGTLVEIKKAIGDSNQLSSEQIEEEEELCYKIDQLVLNRFKLISLREEFVAQIEIDNARIEKLLKIIGH